MKALLGILFVIHGTAFNDTFSRANDAYAAGDYAAAIQGFEQLIAEHIEDPAVFYNLGNAYYRSGKLGPAIANYERALRLDPGLENARQNLAHCVSETKQRLARPLPPEWEQSLLFWHYGLRPETTRTAVLVSWLTLWTLLAAGQWRRIRYLKPAAAAAAVLALAFGASAWVKSNPELLAVAGAETVPVRYGTDDSQTVRFELHEGDRVAVDRRLNGWVRVKTVGGETGWAREASMTLVGPPYERPN